MDKDQEEQFQYKIPQDQDLSHGHFLIRQLKVEWAERAEKEWLAYNLLHTMALSSITGHTEYPNSSSTDSIPTHPECDDER
jgi:hypothetical protein